MTDTKTDAAAVTGERADIADLLTKSRHFLRHTAQGLTEKQATTRSTASELTVGGIIKHVTSTERDWVSFAKTGSHGSQADWTKPTPEQITRWQNGFRLVEGETLAGVLADYEVAAADTDELLRTADLDLTRELPEAPWQPPGVFWTTRRVLLHLAAEIAQHAGHADIIRESIDGHKSMG